jgi:hypothetical protein
MWNTAVNSVTYSEGVLGDGNLIKKYIGKKTAKMIDYRMEDKIFWTEWQQALPEI